MMYRMSKYITGMFGMKYCKIIKKMTLQNSTLYFFWNQTIKTDNFYVGVIIHVKSIKSNLIKLDVDCIGPQSIFG